YWVNEPYAYVSILFDEDIRDHRYHILEPQLSETARYVRKDLERVIRDVWRNQSISDLSADGTLSTKQLRSVIEDHAREVDPGVLHVLQYYLMRDLAWYGPIDPLMRDPKIEDISCDGHDIPVFVYHQSYRDLETNLTFDEDWLDEYTMRLAQHADTNLTAATPRGDSMLPDGSRIQLTLSTDIGARGSNFTIRKFRETPFTPVELVELNTFSIDEMAYLWLAVENNMSVVFVGPTASGKTTSMNAVSLFLPPNSKVVSVEQIREISIPHDNWIASVTRETTGVDKRSDIGMYDLLQDALHQRPEYLLVGEIRTNPEVVRTFFHSIFTGHPGSTTFHARDAESAVDRFLSEPLNVPPRMINSLDIISVQRQVSLKDHRVRRAYQISEVAMPDSSLEVTPLFDWDPYTDSHDHSEDLYGSSRILQRIAEDRGWDELEIIEELYQRQTVLRYLIEHGYTDYDDVITTFYMFARDREHVLDNIQKDTFDPTTIEAKHR
ncbi:type II/IV secretion system ATPase subunit, partial [Halopenitus sp. H-Gu1]|uniref:type II/IV secretion system ATPase subunit n=1 Tax=Halopenitus sp. H-Gu1 TaxID=3242697 RepID=UPI00359E20EB